MDTDAATPSSNKDRLEKQKEIETLQKEIAKLQAETELVVAEAKQKQAEAEKLRKAAEAETEQLIAEAKQKTAEAEKAALLAKFPKGETAGLEGTITTDTEFGYVAEIAAYEAMSQGLIVLSNKIKEDFPPPNTGRVLIIDDLKFAVGDVVIVQLKKTMVMMKNLLEEQGEENGTVTTASADEASRGATRTASLTLLAATPIILQSLISNAADLASYFKSNFEVKGQNFELAREAVTHQLANMIKEYKPIIFHFHLLESSETLDLFSELLQLKRELLNSQIELQIQGIEPLTSRIARDTEDLKRYEEELRQTSNDEHRALEEKITKMKQEIPDKGKKLVEAKAADSKTANLVDAFDKFVESITQTTSQENVPLLAQAALRDFIFEKEVSHLLWIKPISSGGEAITKKQLFRSGHVNYIGGGVISYILTTNDGTSVSSGTTQALAQISHVLSTNRNYRLKHVKLEPVSKNWLERFLLAEHLILLT